jgi:hypothetical protein
MQIVVLKQIDIKTDAAKANVALDQELWTTMNDPSSKCHDASKE